mgnify:CR=1 FL=1
MTITNIRLLASSAVLTAAVGALTATGDTDNATALQASIDAGKVLKPLKPKAEGKATFIAVPKEKKDEAKALGAKWMGLRASWYVPAGVDPAPFVAAGFPVVDLPPRVAKKEG